jgi:hypothetical protein
MERHNAPRKDAVVKLRGVSAEAKAGRVAAKGVARTGSKRRGKYEHEALRGYEFDVSGRLMKKERVFDRQNNIYTERVVDSDTDEIVRDVQEPLSDHTGHGSAKLARSRKNQT